MNYPTRDFTNQYLRQQIENASPAQQLVLLYDGAIKFMHQAKEAIGRGDIQARHTANRRTMEIVGYLLEILDTEKGGEVGMRLQRIYSFILKRLLDVDFKNDAKVCDEVIEHMRILRASWQQIADQGTQPAAAPTQPAAPAAPMQSATVVAGPSGPDPLLPVRRNAVA